MTHRRIAGALAVVLVLLAALAALGGAAAWEQVQLQQAQGRWAANRPTGYRLVSERVVDNGNRCRREFEVRGEAASRVRDRCGGEGKTVEELFRSVTRDLTLEPVCGGMSCDCLARQTTHVAYDATLGHPVSIRQGLIWEPNWLNRSTWEYLATWRRLPDCVSDDPDSGSTMTITITPIE